MDLPSPLIKARLIRRYKRFLADVELPSGEVVTAHVANPGAMIGVAEPGLTVWLSKSADPKRKLPYSWELVEEPSGALTGVNTAHPNRIVAEALEAGAVPEFAMYRGVRREVKYGANSRVDFLLQEDGLPDCYVEVKNVHLRRRAGLAEFPDSVTTRGAKHLDELARVARSGARAAMFYLIQREDCEKFSLAADIDPGYASAFDRARADGVERVAYACRFADPASAAPSISLAAAVDICDYHVEKDDDVTTVEQRVKGAAPVKARRRKAG